MVISIWICGQCCRMCWGDRTYVLDMWSVFCVWVLGSNIAIVLYVPGTSGQWTVCNHVVNAVCSVCGWWDLI